MPQYLVRLAQAHESFRKVELQALADIAGVPLHFVKYEEDVSTFRFTEQSSSLNFNSRVSRSVVLVQIPKKQSQCRVTPYKSIHF